MTSTVSGIVLNNPIPVTTNIDNKQSLPWNQWLGGSTYRPPQSPGEGYDQSLYILTEAYLGQSRFIGQTLELLSLSNNNFLTTVFLPIVMTDQLRAHWTRWEFLPTIPDQVPELGVVRFVKSNRVTGSTALKRYGLGLQMTHAFLNTPMGRTHFFMHIRQINQAFLEGMQLDALHHIMNVENYEIKQARDMGLNTDNAYGMQVRQTIEREKVAWAILQKNPNAWKLMDDLINTAVQRYNSSPLTHYIIDARCAKFLNLRAFDQTVASIYGPNAQAKIRGGIQDAYIDEAGNVVYCAKDYHAEEYSVNPMTRKAEQGEFFRDTDVVEDMSKYTTKSRTLEYWDESLNGYATMTSEQRLENSHRFDSSGRLVNITTLKHNNRTISENEKARMAQDFLHHINSAGEIVPINYFGQMHLKHFTAGKDYPNFALTAFKQLKRLEKKNRADFEDAIRTLTKFLTMIGNYPYDANYEAWAQELATLNTAKASNNGPNADVSDLRVTDFQGNEFGSLDIPPFVANNNANPPVTQRAWKLPPTHGNYGGFKTIAKMVDEGTWAATGFNELYGSQIRDAIKIYDLLADYLGTFLPDSVVMSPKWATSNVHNPTPNHVLFENIVARSNPSRPIFLHDVPAVNRVAANNAVRAGLFGDNSRDAVRALSDTNFTDTAKSRTAIMNSIIGNLQPFIAPLNDAGQGFIGAPIQNIGGANVPYRYSSHQYPPDFVRVERDPAGVRYERPVTQYVAQRFGPAAADVNRVLLGINDAAGNAAPGVDFDTSNAADTLDEARRAAVGAVRLNAFDNVVFDTLARWALLPEILTQPTNMDQYKNQINYYASRSLIITTLALVKILGIDNPRNLWDNMYPILDEIQRIVGEKLHQTADPTGDGSYDRIFATLSRDQTFDRLRRELVDFYASNPQYFHTGTTRSQIDAIFKAKVDDVRTRLFSSATLPNLIPVYNNGNARRTGAERGDPSNDDNYLLHLDADMSTYMRAPITMGANAVKSYVDFLYSEPGMRNVIIGSHDNPNVPISRSELLTVRAIRRNTANRAEMLLEYFKIVGAIFADNYNTEIGSLNIESLPLVKNAKARAITPEDLARRESERIDRLRKEVSMQALSASGNKGRAASMFASLGSDALSIKRRRAQAGGYSYAQQDDRDEAAMAAFNNTKNLTPYEMYSGTSTDKSPADDFISESITQNMKDAFKEIIRNEPTSLASQLISLVRLFTPVTKAAVIATHKNNLLQPWDHLCCRFFARWTTTGVVKMIPGNATGNIALGHILTESGDDPNRQTMDMGVHAYYGTIINNPKNIFVLNDVFVVDYHGGLDSGFIHPDYFDPNQGMYGKNPSDSFMIFAIPKNEDLVSKNMISATGSLTTTDRMGYTDTRNPFGAQYGYSTAPFYDGLYGFSKQRWGFGAIKMVPDSVKYSSEVSTPNLIAYSSYCRSTSTGKILSHNTGHWPMSTVFPGAHDARIGAASFNTLPLQSNIVSQVGGTLIT